MTSRNYEKTDYLYSTDGAGHLVDIYVKQVTVPANIVAGTNVTIGLTNRDPYWTTQLVHSFVIQILTVAGSLYVPAAVGNATTYVLANNLSSLTIAVPAGGTQINAGSIITIMYTVGTIE